MLGTSSLPVKQRIVVPARYQYPLMVIGGAEDKVGSRDILSIFFHGAGGSRAKIGVIPCASREPMIVANQYRRIFRSMGASRVNVFDIRYSNEANKTCWLNLLDDCTGIFVTGGDQLRLCNLVGGTALMEAIKSKLKQRRICLAGTSAGAAMMGETMIAGGNSGESPNLSLVDLTQGLGIIPELVIDQHFHNRNRMIRLISAVAANPDKLGVGIDEDTCAAFDDHGTFEVLGKGTVTVIDPGSMDYTRIDEVAKASPLSLHNLRIHILSKGDRYDYQNRKIIK